MPSVGPAVVVDDDADDLGVILGVVFGVVLGVVAGDVEGDDNVGVNAIVSLAVDDDDVGVDDTDDDESDLACILA